MIPNFVIFLMTICIVIFVVRLITLIKTDHGYNAEAEASWAGFVYILLISIISISIGHNRAIVRLW